MLITLIKSLDDIRLKVKNNSYESNRFSNGV